MNKLIQMGRLTRDPETRAAGETSVARFGLAVDRRFKKNEADFFEYSAFGKTADFVEKYLKKGSKVLVSGRVENNNYTNKAGQKVYGFSFVAEEIYFADSKKQDRPEDAGFMPDDMADEDLPFN